MQADEIKDVAAKTANDIVEKSASGRTAQTELQNLVRANSVINIYNSLQYINWFSFGLGARVNPRLTSPTKQLRQKTRLGSMLSMINPVAVVPRPPIVALQRWEEATDCWCASHEKFGKAQISIMIAKKIYPKAVVVEHIPALATRDIKSAPKDIEIWAEAPSADRAKSINEVMKQSNFSPDCGSAPTPNHVCIGTGKYDIHDSNHVQVFKTIDSSDQMAMGVNKFIVKAASNWGAKLHLLLPSAHGRR